MHRSHIRSTAAVGVALVVALVGCGDDQVDTGAIERGLEQIPSSVYRDADGSSPVIEISDFVAMSELLDLQVPAPGRDSDEVLDSLVELTGGRPADTSQVAAVWSIDPSPATARPDDFESEIGLDIGAIETYAGISALPTSFSVFTGDLELSSSLDEIGGGVLTLGGGDDFERDVDGVSPLRRIGLPLRLGQRDGAVATSTLTPAIESWLEDDAESLADDDRFVEVARAMDRVGAPTAVIVERDFRFDPAAILGAGVTPEQAERLLEEFEGSAVDEPFRIVGVGGAEIDGEASIVAVYLFASDDDAAESVDSIEELWSDTVLASIQQPVSELVDLESAVAEGSVVTVVARPLDGRSTQLGIQFLFRSDVMFQHR
ncbi:MAG: hypothetical protein ABJH68_03710 [Ilumatobacter sp.]|uniref:hypothetical protein n=1 Tax=Ilumatobacter sp. TaxID=1967498 RepID=UPI0032981406